MSATAKEDGHVVSPMKKELPRLHKENSKHQQVEKSYNNNNNSNKNQKVTSTIEQLDTKFDDKALDLDKAYDATEKRLFLSNCIILLQNDHGEDWYRVNAYSTLYDTMFLADREFNALSHDRFDKSNKKNDEARKTAFQHFFANGSAGTIADSAIKYTTEMSRFRSSMVEQIEDTEEERNRKRRPDSYDTGEGSSSGAARKKSKEKEDEDEVEGF
ncbi:hypothetical protein BDA99DRAFT_543638 [Phascolomyces articulosus]|uniref:Uncharacterized protein n=1 Tax=Phascolomyces articulosus TaxID=60185 RepID=A0AAD5P7T1_9FUNG|nr:hypothetical protein BDA99DRAFT_543638 [Phascolomyces articulosus]